MRSFFQNLIRPICAAALIAALPFSAHADRVFLKNGQYLDGLITKETDKHIVLSFGTGSMTIKRHKIKSIERSSSNDADEMRDDWKKDNFLHETYVPSGLENIADKFRTLCNQREKALLSLRQRSAAGPNKQILRREISAFRDRLTKVSNLIKACSPEKEIKEYNALIKERNSLATRMNVLSQKVRTTVSAGHPVKTRWLTEIEQIENSIKETDNAIKSCPAIQKRENYDNLLIERNSMLSEITIRENQISKNSNAHNRSNKQISSYFDTIASFTKYFAEYRKDNNETLLTGDELSFLNTISNMLAGYKTDFTETALPAISAGGSTIVSVLVNDKVLGTFILDTGATTVIISKSFAEQLKIDLNDEYSSHIIMADGSKSPAKPVILESMKIGDAHVQNLSAFILPGQVAKSIDGLLGMSFLENFIMHLDGSTGKLVLEHFNPK